MIPIRDPDYRSATCITLVIGVTHNEDRQALCAEQLGGSLDISSHGRRWEGWRGQACHVGNQSAGLSGLFLQGPVGGRTAARFSVADNPRFAGAGTHRHLQSVLL